MAAKLLALPLKTYLEGVMNRSLPLQSLQQLQKDKRILINNSENKIIFKKEKKSG